MRKLLNDFANSYHGNITQEFVNAPEKYIEMRKKYKREGKLIYKIECGSPKRLEKFGER